MRNNYLWYQFFRYIVVRPALQMFYSEITVSGKENVPRDKPIIFIPNHQNAFLDALHVVTNTNLFIHFLTRADPFQQPVANLFLRSLNMLPVYRAQDGFGAIKKNEETFEKCFKRLKDKDSILVFAEASHDLKRRIRPLSKGFTRIAFGAAKRYNWELDIQIIPVGINYGKHRKSQTPLHVKFGECIPLSSFHMVFLDDEREAAQQLKKTVSEALKKETMHVPNIGHYPFYHLLLDELEENRELLLQPDVVNHRVSLLRDEVDEKLLIKAEQLLGEADSKNLDLLSFVSPDTPDFKDLLLSPFYLFSLVNNALPYQVVRWLTNNYLEDRVFDASAKFLVGLSLLPIYYIVIGTLLGFMGISYPVILGYLLMSFITAPMLIRAKDLIKTSSAQRLENNNPELYKKIKEDVEEFLALRKEVFGDDLHPETTDRE